MIYCFRFQTLISPNISTRSTESRVRNYVVSRVLGEYLYYKGNRLKTFELDITLRFDISVNLPTIFRKILKQWF